MNCVVLFYDSNILPVIMQKKSHAFNCVYYSHATALLCKNTHLKKLENFDCILENMIKSLSPANIQRTPEKRGRYVVYRRVKMGKLIQRKKTSKIT